jgi:CheY-like chemotaxis protein
MSMATRSGEHALVIGIVECSKLALYSGFFERKGYTVTHEPRRDCSTLVVCADHLGDQAVARWGRALEGPKIVLGAEPPSDWHHAVRLDMPLLPLMLEQRILSLQRTERAEAAKERRYDVVVVDDDATIRAAMVDALDAYGLAVRGCGGFADLTGALLKARPDFILLDLNLPGISGQSLGSMIRGRKIPTAVFSSVSAAELKEAQDNIGAVTAFSKTASLATMGRWIRNYLERGR